METDAHIPSAEECAMQIFNYSGNKLNPELAQELWPKVLQHKWLLSEKLGRDVGFEVACMDLMRNVEPMLPLMLWSQIQHERTEWSRREETNDLEDSEAEVPNGE